MDTTWRTVLAAAALLTLPVLWPSVARTQEPGSQELHVEFGPLLGMIDAPKAETEEVRGSPYGIRLGASLQEGWMLLGGDAAALLFRGNEAVMQDVSADRYRVSAYMVSIAVGARTPPVARVGSFRIVGGGDLGVTWLSAFRSQVGRLGPLGRTPGGLPGAEIPEPDIQSGLYLEPLLEIRGEQVGVALRYRVYELSSDLHHALSINWSMRIIR